LPDGSDGGNPCGFLLTLDEGKVYFACDTGLFGDMALLRGDQIDLAILPIGDLFTMGISDSIRAIDMIRPKRVVPDHFNTWPPIQQDASQWALRVRDETASEPLVLKPGGTVKL
jgi:L-ascorbate metabolism protein UlaG (beta-lactamase superfamily)